MMSIISLSRAVRVHKACALSSNFLVPSFSDGFTTPSFDNRCGWGGLAAHPSAVRVAFSYPAFTLIQCVVLAPTKLVGNADLLLERQSTIPARAFDHFSSSHGH